MLFSRFVFLFLFCAVRSSRNASFRNTSVSLPPFSSIALSSFWPLVLRLQKGENPKGKKGAKTDTKKGKKSRMRQNEEDAEETTTKGGGNFRLSSLYLLGIILEEKDGGEGEFIHRTRKPPPPKKKV